MSQYGRLFDPAWATLEQQLAATLQQALMQGYWARHSHVWAEDPLNPPHLQVLSPHRTMPPGTLPAAALKCLHSSGLFQTYWCHKYSITP